MSSNKLTGLIVLPAGSILENGTLRTAIPISAIDTSHPSIPVSLKDGLLRSKIANEFIDDGLSTGHIKKVGSKLIFHTKQSFPSFFGYVMEAYLVRVFNNYASTIGHAAKIWAANLSGPPDSTMPFIAVGTGFKSTKNSHPGLHSNTDPMDIKFVMKRSPMAPDALLLDHLLMSDSTQHAGIQIKAITCNEKNEIILPLKTGRYLNVLTCLEHSDGTHSYETCMHEIQKMRRSGEINELEYHRIKNSIRAPSQIGIGQTYVNAYYKHAKKMHANMKDQGIEVSRFFDQEKEIATIEIADFQEKNGILVPDNLDITDSFNIGDTSSPPQS